LAPQSRGIASDFRLSRSRYKATLFCVPIELLPETATDARKEKIGIDKEHYAWCRDLRRYGSVPHAGFGLDFDRMLASATPMCAARSRSRARLRMRSIEGLGFGDRICVHGCSDCAQV